jgi:hypothetical protein
MFTRLAKSGLVFGLTKFRPFEPQRILPAHSNDNRPGVRPPADAGKRRASTPVLACHWVNRDGRLECRWQVEPNGDAPIGEFGEDSLMGGVSPPIAGSRLHSQNRLRIVLSKKARRKSSKRPRPQVPYRALA